METKEPKGYFNSTSVRMHGEVTARGIDGQPLNHEFATVSGMYSVSVTVFEGVEPKDRVAEIKMTVETAELMISELRKAISVVKFNKRTGRI